MSCHLVTHLGLDQLCTQHKKDFCENFGFCHLSDLQTLPHEVDFLRLLNPHSLNNNHTTISDKMGHSKKLLEKEKKEKELLFVEF